MNKSHPSSGVIAQPRRRTLSSSPVFAAASALLASFALVTRYSSDQASFLDLCYSSFNGNAFMAGLLCLLLFGLFARVSGRGRSLRARIGADAVAFLFSASIVIGRSFSVRESIGANYTYGSFHQIACDPPHLLFSLLMFAGMLLLSRALTLLAFDFLSRAGAGRCSLLSSVRVVSHPEALPASAVAASPESRTAAHSESQAARPSASPAASLAATPATRSATRPAASSSAEPAPSPKADSAFDRVALFLSKPRNVMLALLVFWLPYVIVFFPGCVYYDAADQLRQYYGVDALSSHHPIITTYVFGWLVSLGKCAGSDALGVFLIVVLQVAALCYACTRIVEHVCKTTRNVRIALPRGTTLVLWKWLVLLLVAFFALNPCFGSTVTSIKKDCLFYACFALLFIASCDLCGSKSSADMKCAGCRVALWGTLVSLIRNDGMMFTVALLLCLAVLLLLKRSTARRAASRLSKAGSEKHADPRKLCLVPLACFAVIAVIYFGGYRSVAMPLLNVQSGSIGEALTIPIQQVARYYVFCPEDVDDDMSKGVGGLLDESGLTADIYNPMISDNIKSGYFNSSCTTEDVAGFLRFYARAGLNHPVVYASAFVDQTLGWWYVEATGAPDKVVGGMGLYQNVPKIDLYQEVLDFDMPFYGTPVMTGFRSLLDAFSYIPLVGMLSYPAIYFWAMIVLFAWGIVERKRGAIMLLPLFCYFAICLASPVSGLARYAIPVIMTLPLAASHLVKAE